MSPVLQRCTLFLYIRLIFPLPLPRPPHGSRRPWAGSLCQGQTDAGHGGEIMEHPFQDAACGVLHQSGREGHLLFDATEQVGIAHRSGQIISAQGRTEIRVHGHVNVEISARKLFLQHLRRGGHRPAHGVEVWFALSVSWLCYPQREAPQCLQMRHPSW